MDLNTMLGMPGDALRVTRAEWRRSIARVIQEAFAFHYQRNEGYRAQCDLVRVCPRDIIGDIDLHRIPLLPAALFKQAAAQAVLTTNLADIEIEVRSAGSGGVTSVSPRDATTVTRASVGVFGSFRDFFNLSNGVGLFLCASKPGVAGVHMPKAFNLFACTLDDFSFAPHNRPFDIRDALTQLRSWEGARNRHLIGTPLAISRLMKVLELESIRMDLGPQALIIMFGSRHQYTRYLGTRDEFNDEARRLLGVERCRIRDVYGMAESTMVAIECEHQRKHVPPWCYASIRDLANPAIEIEPGRTGAIAILDALNTAYPGFLLSDDVGEVDESDCPCGRKGQTLTVRGTHDVAQYGRAVASRRIIGGGRRWR